MTCTSTTKSFKISMKSNINKTKNMIVSIVSTGYMIHNIRINDKQVNSFRYFGVVIEWYGKKYKEINKQIRWNYMIKTTFPKKRKIPDVVKKVVWPIMTYVSESRTLTQKNESRINAMEDWGQNKKLTGKRNSPHRTRQGINYHYPTFH